MKTKTKLIFIAIVTLFLAYQIMYRGSGFYDNPWEESDLYRLPLIKPYAIYSLPGFHTWSTNRRYSKMVFDSTSVKDYENSLKELQKIDSIGISQSYIFFHCLTFDGFGEKSHWLIFDTNKARGICYKSESDFRHEVGKLGINIKLYNPEKLFGPFLKDGTLPDEWDHLVKAVHKNHWWIIKYWF